jgi:two-component system, chemotaxis family, chemotaxis protein CheY
MARILIVDDSSLARRSTRKILEGAGHEVVEAEDGLRALERYYLEKPQIVLLDVTMREMDGIEVLKRIRELDPAARVVIVTADVQNSTRELAEAGGACGFVAKPVLSKHLLEAIQGALGPGPFGKEASCN